MGRGYDTPATWDICEAVTPADGADLANLAHALLVLVAGNLSITTANGVTHTVTGATVGTVLPIHVRRVRATGTTAVVAALRTA